MKLARLLLFLSFLVPAGIAEAQTGKISGRITDEANGESLPGVSVIIPGTTKGAVTDLEGYYSIINVSPGTYSLQASLVGYTTQIMEEVRVNIDLTTEVDFSLSEETVGLDEMIVTAQRPIVQRDVSANVANVSMDDVENIPVSSVEGVVGMQAGIEPGISIRGAGASQVQFMVDGMSMRDARNNAPFSGISYTAIEEVQVQTGGFNAEYGNVRSGLINVSTKDGPRDHYTLDVITRYSPSSRKHFGIMPNDETAYWMRPYLDPEVAFEGTSVWDEYTQRQYPEFEGWNSLAQRLQEDPQAPDLTPEQAQETFRWFHRKDLSTPADYEIDGTIGGPVPLVSKSLGDLRFLGSYRQTQGAYIVPQRRDAYADQTAQLKLTSDIATGMSLEIQGLYGEQHGISNSPYGGMWNADLPAYPWSGASSMVYDLESSDFSWNLFALDGWSLADVTRMQLGANFTHTLSPKTFYNLRVQRNHSAYRTGPGPERDFTIINSIGEMELDEAPFGFYNEAQIFDLTGMEVGGRWGTARDSTEVAVWSFRGDITTLLNRYAEFKSGFDINLTNYDAHYGVWNPAQPSVSNPKFIWNRETAQAAAYAQTKLEFQGMVANLGLRLDYFKPQGSWYDYDTFDEAIGDNNLDELPQEPISGQLALSPRIGVSFPITESSKLYFNYGHFRNTQQTPDLFLVRTIFGDTGIDMVGNPEFPLAKTVAYELGYDQNLFDRFLLRIAGYYKAESDQPRDVRFLSLDGKVAYYKPLPLNYGDVRGVEFTLTKNRGSFVRGFANYTYMVRKSGNFGFNQIFESRAAMREEIRTSQQHYPSRPIPEPYANFNLEFLAPSDLGPDVGGLRPLGDWRLSFLGEWRAGYSFTWEGNTDLRISNNVNWKDYYMLDMRLSKNFSTSLGQAQFFIDVTNVLNLRHMNRNSGFVGSFDYENYMMSLHLPEDAFMGKDAPYLYVPGNDKPGDFRKPGVEFVPIEVVESINGADPHPRPLFYEQSTGRYMKWDSGAEAWNEADGDFVEQVLDDKAYIDMPNSAYFTFLNPRNVFFGIRLSL